MLKVDIGELLSLVSAMDEYQTEEEVGLTLETSCCLYFCHLQITLRYYHTAVSCVVQRAMLEGEQPCRVASLNFNATVLFLIEQTAFVVEEVSKIIKEVSKA